LFLGDALYANQSFIQNCNKNHFDYVIVLKDNLKSVNRKCDELFKHKLYHKHYTCHQIEYNEKVEIEKRAS